MALFVQGMRDKKTFDLMERYPRAFMLLCRIAWHMGADGEPAMIGPKDYAIDGADERGLEKRYRTAKELLEKGGFARFESSRSGTLAWAVSGVVFKLKGGHKGGAQGGHEADTKAEQIELNIDLKGGAQGGHEADAKAEQGAGLRPRVIRFNTRDNTNTPPIIPQGGESVQARKVESEKSLAAGEKRRTGEIDFEDFWKAYPARNGKKCGKQNAKEKFSKLSSEDQQLAISAAKNYASSGQMAKDAERFLNKNYWMDWITAADVSNGQGGQQQPGKSGGLMSIKTR